MCIADVAERSPVATFMVYPRIPARTKTGLRATKRGVNDGHERIGALPVRHLRFQLSTGVDQHARDRGVIRERIAAVGRPVTAPAERRAIVCLLARFDERETGWMAQERLHAFQTTFPRRT